jgi:hypothetical protein
LEQFGSLVPHGTREYSCNLRGKKSLVESKDIWILLTAYDRCVWRWFLGYEVENKSIEVLGKPYIQWESLSREDRAGTMGISNCIAVSRILLRLLAFSILEG